MALSIAKSLWNAIQGLRDFISQVQHFQGNVVLNSGGLAIKAGSSALAKTVNTITARVEGVLITKAAADMAALSGTYPTTNKCVAVFTVDVSGTLRTRMSAVGVTTLAAIVFPTIPDSESVIGFAIIENGTGSDFVGGTTALDTGSLTVTYVNTPYPFYPALDAVS